MTCCTGMNGSHVKDCSKNTSSVIKCWLCGQFMAADVQVIWSDKGSRCLKCNTPERPMTRSELDAGLRHSGSEKGFPFELCGCDSCGF